MRDNAGKLDHSGVGGRRDGLGNNECAIVRCVNRWSIASVCGRSAGDASNRNGIEPIVPIGETDERVMDGRWTESLTTGRSDDENEGA
jgi:hypothetical protein